MLLRSNLLGLRAAFLASVTMVGLSLATTAKADADLVCSRHAPVALVRFDPDEESRGPTYATLPRSIDGGLSAASAGRRTDCKLADGRVIRVREGWKQAFPYGMGGADPPAYFSLWIDGRKVLSRRQWKPGYGNEGPRLVAVVLRGNQLLFCPEANGGKPIRCDARTFDLATRPIDVIEYPRKRVMKPAVGSVFVDGASRDRALCGRYLASIRKDFDDLVGGGQDKTAYADSWPSMVKGPADAPRVVEAALEPNGQRRKIAMFSNNSHAFDGDIVAVAPDSTRSDQLSALGADPEKATITPWPDGWAFVSGGQKNVYPSTSARYVHLNPVRINGRLYFFAYPTNRDERPAGMLIGFDRNEKPVAVCRFNRVEQNF